MTAAEALLDLMEEISQRGFCATWMGGVEIELWAMVYAGAPRRYGMAEVKADEIAQLRALATASGLWWRWSDAASDVVPVALDEFGI